MINSITNPFYAEFADEVQAAARERGYYLLLYSSAQSDQETSQEALSHLYSLIDGLLVTKSAVAGSEVQRAAQHAVPVVLCLGWTGAEQAGLFSLVYYDHFRAGKLAAEYLVQLGHRDIGVILPEGHHSLRLEGFRSALGEAGAEITPPPCRILPGRHDPERLPGGSILAFRAWQTHRCIRYKRPVGDRGYGCCSRRGIAGA